MKKSKRTHLHPVEKSCFKRKELLKMSRFVYNAHTLPRIRKIEKSETKETIRSKIYIQIITQSEKI